MEERESPYTPNDLDKSKEILISVSFTMNEGFSPVRGELALWQAVITQALLDTKLKGKNSEDRHTRWQALQWLTGRDRDFLMVCDLAGLDPREVRRKVALALSRGCKWRRDYKKGGSYDVHS